MKLHKHCKVQKCPANGDAPEERGQRLHFALMGDLKYVSWCSGHMSELKTWPRFGGER